MSNQAHAEFFAEAGGAMAAMANQVSRLASSFRRHDLQDANGGLTTLSSELRDFVVMVGVLQGPLAIDPERLTVDGVPPEEQIARLGGWLEAMVEAQTGQDWITLADILEYDLEPVLRAWSDVLEDCATTR